MRERRRDGYFYKMLRQINKQKIMNFPPFLFTFHRSFYAKISFLSAVLLFFFRYKFSELSSSCSSPCRAESIVLRIFIVVMCHPRSYRKAEFKRPTWSRMTTETIAKGERRTYLKLSSILMSLVVLIRTDEPEQRARPCRGEQNMYMQTKCSVNQSHIRWGEMKRQKLNLFYTFSIDRSFPCVAHIVTDWLDESFRCLSSISLLSLFVVQIISQFRFSQSGDGRFTGINGPTN